MGRTRLAADTGGTFIDLVLVDEDTGELVIEKEPAVASERAARFVSGAGRLPTPLADVSQVFHGTTVAINAVLEERGTAVGLVTTSGFRDVLEIGRGARTELYNFSFVPPRPLVPRRLRGEIRERTAANGDVLVSVCPDELAELAARLVAEGAEAFCVSFLNAYANPANERLAATALREWYDLPVTASSDVTHEWREFERTSTAVLNAFVQTEMSDYMGDLRDRLATSGYRGAVAVMQSSGGVVSSARAAEIPVRTLASGPAGGVIGAAVVAEQLGRRNVIAADVGGTSYDVALIEEGVIAEKALTIVGGRPVLAPGLDIVSIGTGGGSIAWIDDRGAIRVGPASAGADPGPACFGNGGEAVTVTDCQLLLGRLRHDRFLGERMQLREDLAELALTRAICAPTGLSLEEAAGGVVRIAETSMSNAIRSLTVERGRDPRNFSIVSYGGAGGFFAAGVAAELDVDEVIIPQAAANFSAWGLLQCDYREDVSQTSVEPLDEASGVVRRLRDLGADAAERIAEHDLDGSRVDVVHQVDLRFTGQEHTLVVTVPELDDVAALVARARHDFVEAHRRAYGHGTAEAPIEIVACRARAVARVRRPERRPWQPRRSAEQGSRAVWFPQCRGFSETAVYQRDALDVGERIGGPSIIEEWATTTVVPPGWTCEVASHGDLVLSRERS